MKIKLLQGLLCGTALSMGGALAAQEVVELDTLVISGSLTPVDEDETGTNVTVVTGDALTRTTELSRTLDRSAGVNTVSRGGLGAQSGVQIRGLPERYVGTRINGIDVSDPSSVQLQYNLGGVTGAGLDRLEVLRGSQSALYGSEYIGGMVDISTWRPVEEGISSASMAEYGSNETLRASQSVGLLTDQLELALTYGVEDSEGISARAGNDEADGFDQENMSFYGAYTVMPNLTIGATALWRDYEVEIDRSATDSSGDNQVDELGGLAFAEWATDAVSHRLSYSSFEVERRDPGGFTTQFNGERTELAYLGSWAFGVDNRISVGFERSDERYEDTSASGDVTTNTAKAELLWRPSDALDLSFALRYDDDSDFGDHYSGRIAAAWRVGTEWTLRGVAGTGFRSPSPFERFSSFGDAALQPEESTSFELGVEHGLGGLGSVKATAFYIEIDDLIDFDSASTACDSGFGCYNQVPGTTITQGVELEGEYALSQALTLYGAYTYTEAETEGERRVLTPRHDGLVGAEAAFANGLGGYVDLRHVADVEASAFAPEGNKVGAYTLLNAGLSYDLNDDTTLYLRGENLNDADYETVGGFNMPGRSLYVGLRAGY